MHWCRTFSQLLDKIKDLAMFFGITHQRNFFRNLKKCFFIFLSIDGVGVFFPIVLPI